MVTIWSEYKNIGNDEKGILKKAELLGDALTVISARVASNVSKKLVEEGKVNTISERQENIVVWEVLLFLHHYSERIIFNERGRDFWKVFDNAVTDKIEKKLKRSVAKDEYHMRHSTISQEYSQYDNLVPQDGVDPSQTAFYQVSKRITDIIGKPDDYPIMGIIGGYIKNGMTTLAVKGLLEL